MVTGPDEAVRGLIEQQTADFVRELGCWLRIRSVSADPDCVGEVRRSAAWLAARLRETGFPVVEVWDTPDGDLPAVFAEWPSEDAGAPTALVYGHHDVQPAAREDGWTHEPFEPLVADGVLSARGAADDKGQVLLHLLGLRAHLAADGRAAPAVHLKLLIEGEEESGSPNLSGLVRREAARLAADVVVVSDAGMWSAQVPTVSTGMRGAVACQIDLYGPDRDLHSGSFGGAVPNPADEAARLAAALHDADRRVTVPGFYDGVVELTGRERALFAALPFDEGVWLAAAGSGAPLGEAGFSTLERIWARPTAEVNGIWGGYTGPGYKTIIPARAQLKLSFRLVAGQDPAVVQEQVAHWVARRLPPGIRHEIEFSPAARACLTPLDHPALQALVRAMGRAFEREILFTRGGGTVPAAELRDLLDAPVLFFGVSVPSDGKHSPGEKIDISLLAKGAEASAYLWTELAEHWKR